LYERGDQPPHGLETAVLNPYNLGLDTNAANFVAL